MIPPEGALNGCKVNVVRARVTASEELPSRNLLLSSVYIVGPREHTYVCLYGRTWRVARENVENWLSR